MLEEEALGFTAKKVAQTLKDGNPAIYVGTETETMSGGIEGAIVLNPHCIQDGEEVIVANRLKKILRLDCPTHEPTSY
jgi:hypothetical protein